MYCLHCGDCCLRMSPLSAPEPCPNIDQRGDFYFCDNYRNRPEACVSHDFPSNYCPIGVSKLGLATPEEVRQRLDAGYALLKYGGDDVHVALNLLYL